MSRGIHTKPNNGNSVDWITPKEIPQSIGNFDLDPCAHPQQLWHHANHNICLPQDGLAIPWFGRVWLNPPYGPVIKEWLKKLAAHGNGIALVPGRTEVERWFWPFIWEKADAIFFFRGRLYFHKPDGSTAGNAGHGSVLAIYGKENVGLVRNSSLVGQLVEIGKT